MQYELLNCLTWIKAVQSEIFKVSLLFIVTVIMLHVRASFGWLVGVNEVVTFESIFDDWFRVLIFLIVNESIHQLAYMRFKLFEFSGADLFLENSKGKTASFLNLFELIGIFKDPVHGYHSLAWALQNVLNATQMIHL